MKHIIYLWIATLTICLSSCTDDTVVSDSKGEGTLLSMYAEIAGANTRLAEIGDAGNMNLDDDTHGKGKKNIGLYIYYEDDYKNGDLSKPYIRNLECTVENGKLKANEDIYIYDRMTIVAFYPYNETMNLPENYFTVKSDEKAYPITESDYANQRYIPYRAETTVNPTNAYMVKINFSPQQTCKFEIVLVANNPAKFPYTTDYQSGDIKIVPKIDMYPDSYNITEGDRREQWLDGIASIPSAQTNNSDFGYNPTEKGGQYVRRYTAYVWKSGADDKHHNSGQKHDNNKLEKGDILFQSKELTLLIPHGLDITEETVYRYGYNLETGEIFIPTSDKLIYDATSLQDASFNEYHVYQVCDVDLSKSSTDWQPLTTYSGTYDGGGHAIKNLKFTAAPGANVAPDAEKPDKQAFGLFSSITGKSTLKNIHLVSPEITVDYSNAALKDTCYVGALCGMVNPELSDAEKERLIRAGLPDELSETVKKALVADAMKNFASTTCYIQGCKVSNPQISVKGENVRVGALLGGAGNQKQKAEIKDSYAWQDGSSSNAIAVNAGNDTDKKAYKTAYVSGFCGMLSNGSISNCYSNMTSVSGYIKQETPAAGGSGNPTISGRDIATGFCNLAPEEEIVEKDSKPVVSDCYTAKADKTSGVTDFTKGWPRKWPLFKNDETVSNRGGLGTSEWPAYKWTDSWKELGTQGSVYPKLIWEEPLIMEYQ